MALSENQKKGLIIGGSILGVILLILAIAAFAGAFSSDPVPTNTPDGAFVRVLAKKVSTDDCNDVKVSYTPVGVGSGHLEVPFTTQNVLLEPTENGWLKATVEYNGRMYTSLIKTVPASIIPDGDCGKTFRREAHWIEPDRPNVEQNPGVIKYTQENRMIGG